MRSCLVEVHHIRIEDALEFSLMKDQQVGKRILAAHSLRSAHRWHWLGERDMES